MTSQVVKRNDSTSPDSNVDSNLTVESKIDISKVEEKACGGYEDTGLCEEAETGKTGDKDDHEVGKEEVTDESDQDLCEECDESEADNSCQGCGCNLCDACIDDPKKTKQCAPCLENDEYYCNQCSSESVTDGYCEVHEKHRPKRVRRRKGSCY